MSYFEMAMFAVPYTYLIFVAGITTDALARKKQKPGRSLPVDPGGWRG
jgi:hypothetical protein